MTNLRTDSLWAFFLVFNSGIYDSIVNFQKGQLHSLHYRQVHLWVVELSNQHVHNFGF